MIVRLFLLAAIALAVVWVIRSRATSRRLAVSRLAVLALAALWAVAVIRPDLVTVVAHKVGVGRGTDLVLYVLVVAFTFVTVGMYRRIRDLDDRLAQVTRAHALLQHHVDHPEDEAPRTHA